MVKLEEVKRHRAMQEHMELLRQLQEWLNVEKLERCSAERSSKALLEECQEVQRACVQHIVGWIKCERSERCREAVAVKECINKLSQKTLDALAEEAACRQHADRSQQMRLDDLHACMANSAYTCTDHHGCQSQFLSNEQPLVPSKPSTTFRHEVTHAIAAGSTKNKVEMSGRTMISGFTTQSVVETAIADRTLTGSLPLVETSLTKTRPHNRNTVANDVHRVTMIAPQAEQATIRYHEYLNL